MDRPINRKKSQKRRRIYRAVASLTPEEYERFQALVEQSGLSAAGYVRQCVLGDPGARTQRQASSDQKLLGLVLGQLGKIGSNLAQINRLNPDSGLIQGMDVVSDMRACVLASMQKSGVDLDRPRLERLLAILDAEGQAINQQAYIANSRGVHLIDKRILASAIVTLAQQQTLLLDALGANSE